MLKQRLKLLIAHFDLGAEVMNTQTHFTDIYYNTDIEKEVYL